LSYSGYFVTSSAELHSLSILSNQDYISAYKIQDNTDDSNLAEKLQVQEEKGKTKMIESREEKTKFLIRKARV